MYDNEIVSVITPVYNAEKFIKDTVLSAVRQTYRNMEIVLVDDKSTDTSAQIIKKLQDMYPNIIYHLQRANGGAGIARNVALDIARGRYVAFLDSDDIWVPQKTELQIKLMREENAFFSYTAIEMIDEEGKTKKMHNIKEKVTYEFLLKNTIIATSTVIIDRKKNGEISYAFASRRSRLRNLA
jgi:teichuronic acid biosynthesis glycosyltransferase TuaG